jgi:hypothetical protein
MAKIPPSPFPSILDAVKGVVDAAAEYGKVKQQETTKREEIRCNRDIILKKIEAAREIILTTLDQDFALRSKALDAQLILIEKALDDNNLEALNMGLNSLVLNIQSSPLKNFDQFKLDFKNKDSVIEI